MRAEAKILEYLGFTTASTIDFASNSTSTANMLRLTHRLRPFLSAQSSTRKLVVIPILRANLTTYPPSSLRIKPPPLAKPGFPREEPSVFNFNQPATGLDHRIALTILTTGSLAGTAQKLYSKALWTISFANWGFGPRLLKIV